MTCENKKPPQTQTNGETNMTRKLTNRIIVALRILAAVISAAFLISVGSAEASNRGNKSVKHEMVVTINASGDATFNETLTMPMQVYMSMKEEYNNPVKLFRTVQNSLSWNEIEDLRASFDDAAFSIKGTYTHRGYLRVNRTGQWTLKFPNDSEPELLTTSENIAILTQAVDSKLGAMSQTMRINFPAGSSQIEYNKSQNELTFVFEPENGSSKVADVNFELDSKPHLMSCLATLYGDESFSNFWAARSVFKNSGEQPISDYRVRFRIAGHSGWSQWNRSKVVYPGQTVVDPYFPVFDLNTLSDMSAARPAMIEVEYEYESADGTKVQETDATRVQLLSRNQVVYSSRKQDETLDWAESFEYGPFIISAFAHSEDPAIQQLAGRVAGMADGAAASYSDEDAEKFLTAMWKFMEMNKIAYQSPPSLTVNNTFGQNVKYGRDVLRNRAGTCIDLAILWASSAKAVGLKSYVVLIPGHAFPVIGLPGGNVMPIESTVIGKGTFAQATEIGVKTYNEALKGNHYMIDIDQLQDLGVRSLDLAKVDDNFLGQLGYKTEEAGAANETKTTQETNYREEQTNTTASVDPRDLVGTWGIQYEEEGKVRYMQFTFTADAEYIFCHYESRNAEWVKFDEGRGTWGVQDSTLIINNSNGNKVQLPFRFAEGKLIINSNGTEAALEKTA